MKKWSLIISTSLLVFNLNSFAASTPITGTYNVESCKVFVNLAEIDSDALCEVTQIKVESLSENNLVISYYLNNSDLYYRESLTRFKTQNGKISDSAKFENSENTIQWSRSYRDDSIFRHLDEIRKFEFDSKRVDAIRFTNAVGDVISSKYKFTKHEYVLTR